MMNSSKQNTQSGSALYLAVVITIVLFGFTASMLSVTAGSAKEHRMAKEHLERLYIAEAGIEAAVLELTLGQDGNIGAPAAPQPFGAGGYWVTTVDNGNQTFTLTSTGVLGSHRRVVQALVQATGSVFNHAIFAGNKSGDPGYVMPFGGNGSEADVINGDVYSGQDLYVWGDATMNGNLRSAGSIVGASGTEGVTQPVPDLAAMNYAAISDVDVAAQFAASGYRRWDNAGGRAWQLPSSNPAHIFRKNPDDRTTEIYATVKDDYFLEDPYQPVRADYRQDGSDPFRAVIDDGSPSTTDPIRLLYYIDGNLWIHNRRSYSLQLAGVNGRPVQVTMVVKGNVYISDNLFYSDKDNDGLAIIALKDEAVADSGNIYFGDPRYGTLMVMDAFMYADENFFDNNLSASGSARVTLNGTMSAGNHVAIMRDYAGRHSKLTVNEDARLRNGQLSLPGIPDSGQQMAYEVVYWQEVSPNT